MGPSRDQVKILHKCMQDKSLTELLKTAGRSNRTKFRDQVVKPLIQADLLTMTIPDKPNSSLQKYRVTNKGQKFINKKNI